MASSSNATIPGQADIQREALTFPDQARRLAITSPDTYARAAEFLKIVKALRGKVAETFDAHITRAFQAHRALTAEKQKAEAPLTEAETVVKRAMVEYDQAERRRQQEAQRKADEAARRRAEDEQLARAAAMETEAHEFGDVALAEQATAVLETPVHAVAPTVEKQTPKVSGVSMRDNWKYRVTNPALVPREYLMLDESKIGRVVKAMKDATTIPGVEVFNDPIVASRAS